MPRVSTRHPDRAEEPSIGRPRSEAARHAVLNAVDDMLVEHGYAALTMKGIAERAGVGRQTVYRWWSTKAEILFEACAQDAATELAVRPTADPVADITNYLVAVATFLTRSTAGAGYRALLGEAQHDPDVADLLRGKDVLTTSARLVIDRAVEGADRTTSASVDELIADLVGPVLFPILTGAGTPTRAELRTRARRFLENAHRDGAAD